MQRAEVVDHCGRSARACGKALERAEIRSTELRRQSRHHRIEKAQHAKARRERHDGDDAKHLLGLLEMFPAVDRTLVGGVDEDDPGDELRITLRKLADPSARPQDFAIPGHVFPLRATEGGVLRRTGHTEAAVDLARLAGLQEAGVLCEILNEDGTMSRLPDLHRLAHDHGLTIVSIEDLIRHRRRAESLIERLVETTLPTERGTWDMILYSSRHEEDLHIALVKGSREELGTREPLVRVHSQCLTGDLFGSLRCDCGDQLHQAMRIIEQEGLGVLLYMRQEGRGIGLVNKLRAYNLQDHGADTVVANEMLGFKADERDYGVGAQILYDLGIRRMRLLTNNPSKRIGLESYGLTIVDRIPITTAARSENIRYLATKRDKLGHLLPSYERSENDGKD